MLSKEEKQELLEDGHSFRRRKEFARLNTIDYKNSRSLDEFIRFLISLQRIFSPFVSSKKATSTRFNKL